MHELRNEADGRSSPPGMQSQFTAYFGTYTLDVARRIVTHQVAASLSAEHTSGDLQRNYELSEAA